MNILVLTSEYPGSFKDPNNNITPIVHYFTREWVKQGHSVIVIHNAHRFPYIIHALPKKIKDDFTLKHGFSIMGVDYIKKEEYILDGVRVWRLPIIKFVPHGNHLQYVIKQQARRIEIILKSLSFTPDIIIGHWASPQMQLIKELKPIYNCKTALTLHDLTYLNRRGFEYRRYIEYIDKIGFRNKTDREKAKQIIGISKPTYTCYSGIPDDIIKLSASSIEKYQDDLVRVIYVGRLIERKHIDSIIRALHDSNISDYIFTIVGTGPQEATLKELVKSLNDEKKVIFLGRLKREEIINEYRKSHLFVMISSGEAFGLVYLEAMAAKCVPIGSLNEGIDGIVVDGDNGFLCKSGDTKQLTMLLNKINDMQKNRLAAMSEKAEDTAREMSDSKMAKKYLEVVLNN